MRERAATVTVDGVRYYYAYRDSWGRRYYSMDGETWHETRREALRVARESGRWIMRPRAVVDAR